MRDHDGKWIKGFTMNVGRSNGVETELWTVLHGLKMTWENGHRKICLEVDFSKVIK